MNARIEKINSRLSRFRKDKGLTLKEVAQAIGVSESTYRDWEYGRAIQGEPYMALAEVFEISLHELMSGKPPAHAQLLEELELMENQIRRLRQKILLSGC